jgi:hypothetical protein
MKDVGGRRPEAAGGVKGLFDPADAVILTGLLTFVIMPRYTRLVRAWLYKDAG